MSNLREILQKLKSSKITERQEGLTGIQTAFSKNSFLRKFHLAEDDDDTTEERCWRSVFDALAVMIRLEKAEYSRTVDKGKPPKPNVVKRLTDTARTIRTLVEKAVTFFGRTDTQSLVKLLYEGIFLKNELLTLIALDYAKTLKCILGFRPHLEHLKDDIWEDLVALAFNVVLGEPLRGRLDQDMDSASESGEATSSHNGNVEDEEDEDEDEDELPVLNKKRKRGMLRVRPSQTFGSTSKFKHGGSKATSVSLEQVEFASILSILLGYSGAPLLVIERPYLPQSILHRMERFLVLYPADSSLLYDYLPTLSSVLDHLALNHVKDTQRFARNTWDILIGLWNTKDKSLREHLIVVIRALMPYLTADFGLKSFRDSYDQAGALWKLYNTLEGEMDNRRGVETLALDSLRLEINTDAAHEGTMEAFVAHTFRAGLNFDTPQAVSWAILQTQADCVAKLYELSESMNSGATPVPLRGEKKRKLDNGISSILTGIQTGSSQHARIFNLQVLLFLIDRNWLSIHLTLKHYIIDSLLQLVASEDTPIQIWTLLCLAAIVYAERFLAKVKNVSLSSQSLESQSQAGFETGIWDSVWTHSIRRVNSPPTCRAASHTAYTLIYQAVGSLTISLPSQRILSEIEILSSDLEVQGPAYPYDSVCNFLAQCVNLAGQDARLYRIHLEDKVVGWIVDHWKVTATAKIRSMPPTLQDGVNLLEAICGFSRRSHLISRGTLPSCDVVMALQREVSEERVRNFLLSAQLPVPHSRSHVKIQDATTSPTAEVYVGTNTQDLSQPQARERKISAFFLRSIELLTAEWEGIVENHTNVTADAAQQSLEHALTSLVFESLLVYNGVASNRHLIQASAKLISTILPLLNSSTWNYVEKATVLSALEPLILLDNVDNSKWEVVLPPGTSSGIKRRILNEIMDKSEDPTKQLKVARTNLLRILWRMSDAQNCLQNVVTMLRQLFCKITTSNGPEVMGSMGTEIDERDGFGPVRVVAGQTGPPQSGIPEADPFILRTMEICLRFVVNGPLLHSLSGEPTKDTEVIDAVLVSDVDNPTGFLAGFPLLLSDIQRRTFSLGGNLERCLKVLGKFLTSYKYQKSERMLQITCQLLNAILESWLNSAEVRKGVEELLDFLLKRNLRKQARYRSERDAFIRFVEQVVIHQPRSLEWVLEEELTREVLLTTLPLGPWNTDNDVRVRFRAAVLNARIFHALQHLDISPSLFYTGLQEYLNQIEVEQHERVLSRFLALGNIIVASSSVRRGPYWHLIETCLFADQYSAHIEAILTSVSRCLGLTPSLLFEAYASQMGYSMIKSEGDISRIPPHLIGFEDRKQSAAFALSAFAPTYITSQSGPPFETHCKLVGVTPEDTYANCFGDIVGAVATNWFKMHPNPDVVQLEKLLQDSSYSHNFHLDLRNNADGVALAVVRSLSDQILSPAGPIHQALQTRSKKVAQTFTDLVKYRPTDSLESHESNLPAFEISVVLPTLSWLLGKVQDESKKSMTYHVLHGLFAAVYASPVVNEQIRLVNALSVWTALRCEDFDDPTLLHTLVQGSTALLAEYDLARAAQSILEWAFYLYRKLRLKDSAFSNIIIRICSIAYDYARSPYPDFQKLGNVLMDWMDKQAIVLSRSAVQIQIVRALPTWPYVPIPELAQIAAEQSSEGLEALLDDPRITYNKFRLVRRLCDHIAQGGRLKARFSKHDFWRLKDCIPAQTELQQDDADAFASLLILGHGDISGITRDYQSHRSILTRYRPWKRRANLNDPSLNNEIIIYSLLQLLDSHSPKNVFSAYETLRRIMAVLDNFAVPSGSSDYNSELEHLRAFPRRARTRPLYKLEEVVAPDTLLELTADFNRWISTLSSKLSDFLPRYNPIYAQLSSVLLANAEFAADLLPVLVHAVLRTEIQKDKYVSKNHRRILTDYFTSVLSFEQASTACRQSVIDIVLHLREFFPQKEVALSYNEWLDLDYILLAKNAVSCGAYTTALLFLELSVDHPSAKPQKTIKQEDILYEIYSHIDEPDGFYGIKTSNLQQFLIRRFHHEKQWEKALQFHGATVEADPNHSAGSDGLLQAFSSFGFNHLVMRTLRTPGSGSSALDYRLGWRTETWDLPDSKEFITNSSLYSSLRALYRERNPHIIDSITQRAISRTMDRLRSLGPENMTEIRETVQELMCLKEVKDWRDDIIQLKFRDRSIKADEWSNLFDIDTHFDFSDLELIMATRVSLLHSARQKEERQQIGTLVTPLAHGLKEVEKRCLVRLSHAARGDNHVQIALNSILRAQQLCGEPSIDVAEEYASVLWEQNEQGAAIQYLQSIIQPLDHLQERDAQQAIYHALLKARLGSWIATACLESPTAIWENYLQKAVEGLETNNVVDIESSKSRATVYHDCALFAEQQYHLTLKSPDGVRFKVYVDRKTQEVQHWNTQLASAGDKASRDNFERQQSKAKKVLQQDSEQFRKHITNLDQFLGQALEMYAKSLEVADTYNDDASIRFCSLWFSNFENEGDLQNTIDTALSRIPSYKMVLLAHQLTARLSWQAGELPQCQQSLQKMILRMCKEHPFHSLYQVYCLLPERSISDSSRRQSGRLTTPSMSSTQTERGSAAQVVFDKLRADSTIQDKVTEVEKLCNASWQWAKYPLVKSRYNRQNMPYPIPSELLICRLPPLRVPVPTLPLPLDPTMRYDNCVCVDSFEKQFETAGGINLPKISSCKGSNGKTYKQLFKGGNDDLRQDAVMEQVFDVVNGVLRRDRQTKRRELGVRGYKVIPLDSQTGVLEFVTNTTPLRAWLMAGHRRYRPKDMSHEEVRQRHERAWEVYKVDADREKILKVYHETRSRVGPVMRHYFTEKNKSPVTWFAMRLKYTRSVATTSIVGHILGLGDRHTSNILMDNSTGELVHIDLGIAFDQGKLLTVPETVPFRMNPNMIDGMGSSGTRGVFQRCAEETLRVLRDGSDVIMTILEVFKHDPLHSWTLSDTKYQNAQRNDQQQTAVTSVNDLQRHALRIDIGIDMSSGGVEEAADRALSSVSRKLDKALSVEYTVNQLIAEATEPFHLATIFHGWMPHC